MGRRLSTAGVALLAALAAAGCAPPGAPANFDGPDPGIHLRRHYTAVKATYVGAAKAPLDSGVGGGVSYSFVGAAAVVAEVLDMELDDGSGLLQSRLYAKLNLPVVPLENFQLAIAPLIGYAYTDPGDAPGWSVKNSALFSGAEMTAVFWPADASGIFLNLRWAYTDWELTRPGAAEKVMSSFEASLGYVHQF